MRKADVALYEAKRRGKSQYRVFHPSMRDALRKRRTLAFELERAVSEEELTRGLPAGRVARRRPRGGARGARALEPPRARAGAARASSSPSPRRRAPSSRSAPSCSSAWSSRPAKLRIPIHANVCAPELIDPGFLDRLDALVDIHELPPELLVFELTERAFVGDDPVPIAVLEALHERGMGVAVDDFGTGYSSLAYLSRLPVDTMKIPKQFIDDVTGSREHHALARAVIELGSALDLKVIAEGIETPEQIAALRAFGCDLGQGFYYGMPTDAELCAAARGAAAREPGAPGAARRLRRHRGDRAPPGACAAA